MTDSEIEQCLMEIKKGMFSNKTTLDDVRTWILKVNECILTSKGIKLKRAIELRGVKND